MNNTRIRSMVITALLIGLVIVIPAFSYKIILPPFTATIASHVPIMLAMCISPASAFFVSIGSAIGFIHMGPPVVARAATHIIFSFIGACLVRRKMNFALVGAITMIPHALAESLVVLPFLFADPSARIFYSSVIITGVGTMLHHIMDFTITSMIALPLKSADLLPNPPVFSWKNKPFGYKSSQERL